MQLTKQQARRCLLAYQGLWPGHSLSGKDGILGFIRQVGCIQFDPLDIVGHNSDLVLQSRVVDYRRAMLRELLYNERKLLDGFDKMMAIYPVEDWPYFRRRREAASDGSGRSAAAVQAIAPEVRAAIQQRGPLSSLDLDMREIVDWDWSQSRLGRAALESMYFWGELVIHHRVHTRKVYDFSTRWLPEDLLNAPDPNVTDEQYQDWYVLRRLGSMGLAWNRSGEGWLAMQGIQSKLRTVVMGRLLAQGRVSQAHIEGIKEPLYFRTGDLARLTQPLEMDEPRPRAVLMAPLDNLLWDRRFLAALFDFDYHWEVYVPQGKRRYGYYVLPLLYGDRFIARVDVVKDKKKGSLVIKNWWWEPDAAVSEPMKAAVVTCFQRFSAYLGLAKLEVERQPREQAGLHWLETALS